MKTRSLIPLILGLALTVAQAQEPAPAAPGHADRPAVDAVAPGVPSASMAPPAPATGSGWMAAEEDNISGISNVKRVSKPAVVDYDHLLESTPQMRKVENEGIEADSAEGVALRKQARILITKSCERVRAEEGYCSVWKAIAHRDGRAIPDITEDVVELF